MKRSISQFLGTVESFFRQYLQTVRGASPHTVRAYRDTLRLFLEFLSRRCRHPIDRLNGDHITCEHVSEFLAHLETGRRTALEHGMVGWLPCVASCGTCCGRIRPGPGNILASWPCLESERSNRRLAIWNLSSFGPFSTTSISASYLESATRRFSFCFTTPVLASAKHCNSAGTTSVLSRPGKPGCKVKGPRTDFALYGSRRSIYSGNCAARANFTAESAVFFNRRGEPLSRDGAAHLLRVPFRELGRPAAACPKFAYIHIYCATVARLHCFRLAWS